MVECRFLINGLLDRSPFHHEQFFGQLSVKHESKSRRLQQRRRRLEREKRHVTNVVTYPQGIIKNWTVSYVS